MRHNLIISFSLSLLILATVLLLAILAGPPRNTVFYGGPVEPGYFTPAFSENVNSSNLLKIFGSPKLAMIVLSASGLLLHAYFLYKLTIRRKSSKKAKDNYLTYWGILFAPYLLILIFTI